MKSSTSNPAAEDALPRLDTTMLQPQEAILVHYSIKRKFPNYDYQYDRNFNIRNPVETTFEFKFSRDLILFVLHEYMTGLHWIPTVMFAQRNLDSPFTPQFKAAIKAELDTNGPNLHELYDDIFPDKSTVAENYAEICTSFKDTFVSDAFSPKTLIKFCAILGITTGLSYLYGVGMAPYQSFLLVVSAMKEIKSMGKVDDNVWNEIQDWVESRINSEGRFIDKTD